MNQAVRHSQVLSFVSGRVLTALMTSITGNLEAAKNANRARNVIHVCLTSAGELRVTAQSGCPPGQASLNLQRAGEEPGDVSSQQDSYPAMENNLPASEEERADLARKVSRLERDEERGELTETVAAPFEIDDAAHNPIFKVTSDGGVNLAQLFDPSREPVVSLVGKASGGQVAAGKASTAMIYIGTFTSGGGFLMLDHGAKVLDLGNESDGPYHLKVSNAQHQTVAAIGENSAGSGTAVVADASGDIKATVGVTVDGHGAFSSFGGGLLVLYGAGGPSTGPMVAAGTTDKGIGLVQVGPNGFKAGLGVLGLPGSYISGKQ